MDDTRTDGHADDRSPQQRAFDDADAAISAAERNLTAARVARGRANAAYDDAVTATRTAYDAWADARDALSPDELDAWRNSCPAPTDA